MTIAIAGGSGRLGRLLVERLREKGESVRVLTRDRSRLAHLRDDEIAIGDVRERGTLDAFVAGAKVVVSAVHGFVGVGGVTPASVDRDGNANLIDAAKSAGADVVLVAIDGASPDHPMELMRMKYAAEQRLAQSGVPHTIVRATAFMETWVDVMRQTANAKHGPLVFGRGENPINFVSVRDVAALLERVVLDPATRGQTLSIGGPDDVSLGELAARVAAAHGLKSPKQIPPIGLRIASLTVGLVKPAFGRQVRAALAMDRMNGRLVGASARDQFAGLPLTRFAEVL
jgi:NADH dehydrogenase